MDVLEEDPASAVRLSPGSMQAAANSSWRILCLLRWKLYVPLKHSKFLSLRHITERVFFIIASVRTDHSSFAVNIPNSYSGAHVFEYPSWNLLSYVTISSVSVQWLCSLTETSSIDWAQVSRFHMKAETESSPQKVVGLNKRQEDS
jgi:hypothetical protein